MKNHIAQLSRFMLALVVPVLICGSANLASAASIGTPTYTSYVDIATPTNNLTSVGTLDWAVWSGGLAAGVAPTTTGTGLYDHKLGGSSISMGAPVTNALGAVENLGTTVRSIMRFTWSNGANTSSVTNLNPNDSGLAYGNTAIADYGQNTETITFVPGDLNPHTIHLYGYITNNVGNLTNQFTASLSGATTNVINPTPVLGNFDYSVTFRADNARDALTVVFTFQKTGNGTSSKRLGIQAATISAYVPPTLIWQGGANTNWDTTSLNWTNASGATVAYTETGGASTNSVTFDDTSTKTNVNVVATVKPLNVIVNSANNYTISGSPIAGSGSLTKSGAGTLTLSGANTFTNGVIISAGTLKLGASGGLPSGAGVGDVTVNGTLDLNGFSPTINGLNGSNTVDSVSAGGNLSLTVGANNASGVFSGVIKNTSGSVSLLKIGAGAQTLSGVNTFTGGVELDAGQLNLNSTTALGATASTLTIQNSGVTIGNTSGATRNLVNANPQIWNGNFTYAGTGFNLGLGSGPVTMNGSRTVTVSSNTLTVAGNISGAGFGLTKNGTGQLTITGTNTYDGTTAVNAGTLLVSTAHAGGGVFTLADGANLSVNGSAPGTTLNVSALNLGSTASNTNTLSLFFTTNSNPSGAIVTVGSLTTSNTVVINIGGTALVVGQFPLISYAGSIGGLGYNTFSLGTLPYLSTVAQLSNNVANHSIDLVVIGAGGPAKVWVGNNNNDWDINNTLNWLDSTNASAAYNEISGIGDSVLFSDTASNFTVNVAATVVPSTITINNTNNAYSIGGSPIAGPAKLTKQGAGVLTLTSNNTLTNGVTLSAGVLRVGADGAVGSGLLTLVLGTLSSADTTAHTLTNALQINNGVTLGDSTNNGTLTLSGPLNLNGNNETLTVKSDVILSGGSTNGSIYKAGANTLTLQGGVHNWSNPILVNNGVMVLNSAYLTNSSTTELRVSSNQTNGIARLTINGGAVVLTAPGAFLRLGYSEFGNTTAGGIAGGATNILDVAGLISMPNNTNGGILIGRSSILSVVNLLTGGDLAVKNVTGSDLTGNKTPWLFNFNGGTLRASVDNTTFFQPATNSTVYVQNGGAVFNTSGYNITVNQSLVEDPNSTGGGLTKNGNGILTLGGTNTYTGSTTVNQGKLVVPTTAAGSGAITVADAGSLGVNLTAAGATFSATSVTLGTSAAHNGTLDIALGGFVNPTVAPFTITSALAANGTNTINLTGTNLVLGSFPLISYPGTLGVGVFNTFKLGSLPSGIGGLLVNNTANNTIDLNITNAAVPPRQWVGNINGNWDINGTSNWLDTVSGGSAVYLENAGGNPALTFNDSASTFTVSVVANVSPGSMTVNNTTAYSIGGNPIGGTGSLLKTNTGTLTLTSSNAYSGGTTLQAGTLKLGANGALGSGVLTTSGGLLSSDSTVARTNVLAGVTFISAATLGDTNNVNTGQLVLSGKVNWNGGIRQMTVAGDVVLSGGSTNGGFVKFGTGVWTFLGGTHSLTRVATASLGDVVFDGATISNSVGQAFVVNCTQPAGLARLVLTNGANWTDYYSGIPDVYIGNTGDVTATNLLELAGTFTAGPGGVARLGASCALAQVDLFNGGVLEVAGVTSTNGGASVLNFNGGTLRALADSTNFIAGLTNVYVQNGGGTIDSSSNSIIVTQPLLLGGTGGLTKAGTGLLTLDSLNTYTNTTLVSAGTLAGTGTLAGPLTVGINGSLAPGDGGVGTFTINGKLTLTAGGTNYVDINASTGTNDLVTGLTSATYAGTLVVSNLATGTPPTNGQSFQIFNAVGSPVGNFSSLTPAPATNLVWNFNPTTGVLKAVTAVVPSPVANPDFASTYWNVPVTVLALTNDTDPGSNPLTIVSVSPTNGTASIVNSTNVLFTPTNGAAGTGYVGYAITNGNGGSANSLITVTVLTPPKARITSVTRSGNNLVLNATNGAPNGIYAVLTSTNVALPLASWTPIILGGAFDASGNFTGILIPMTNGAKSFYSIKQ